MTSEEKTMEGGVVAESEKVAEIAAQYDKEEIEADYPIPEETPSEKGDSRFSSVKQNVTQNLKHDILAAGSSVKNTAQRVLNHEETMREEGVTATVTNMSKIKRSGEIKAVNFTFSNGKSKRYKWRFNEDHSTKLQQFVDYYADGYMTELKGTSVYVGEHGKPIVPEQSGIWFRVTNNLRPYGWVYPVVKGSKASLSTISPMQRVRHHPRYDFGHEFYLGLCTVLAPLAVFMPFQVHGLTGSVSLAIMSYVLIHLLAIPAALRSSNDNSSSSHYLLPWIFSFIGFLMGGMVCLALTAGLLQYIWSLSKER